MTLFLPERHMRHPGVFDQDLIQMILIGKRPYRGCVPHEHLRAFRGGAAGANVLDHRPADTSLSSGSVTLRPVFACTTDRLFPGQSRSLNSSLFTSMPRSPRRVISKMIA